MEGLSGGAEERHVCMAKAAANRGCGGNAAASCLTLGGIR